MSALTPGNACLLSESPSVWSVGSRTKPIILGSFSSLSPESSQMLDLSKAKSKIPLEIYVLKNLRKLLMWLLHSNHGCSANIKSYQLILPTSSSLISQAVFLILATFQRDSASDHKVSKTKHWWISEKVSGVEKEERGRLKQIWKENVLRKLGTRIFSRIPDSRVAKYCFFFLFYFF